MYQKPEEWVILTEQHKNMVEEIVREFTHRVLFGDPDETNPPRMSLIEEIIYDPLFDTEVARSGCRQNKT